VALAAALALAIGMAGTARAREANVGEHWVTTWMAAPMKGSATDSFRDRTIRMVVHTSIGGKRLRIEISNALGRRSLAIGAAYVGIAAKGAGVVAGTNRELEFDGSATVTIPAGALMVSDPVELDVKPLSALAITLYVPDETGVATEHPLGLETTYISGPGNFAAAETMPYKWTTDSWYWISAVDVEASAQTQAIVALGDSITDGANSTVNANQSWPAQLAARFQANPETRHLAVVNAGISGNRVLHDDAGPNALARFDRDVLARDGVKYVMVLEGINDLGFPHLPGAHGQQEVTAAQLIAGLRQIIMRAHAHGIKVIGCTLTPYQGAVYYSGEGEAKREAINRWIRTSGAFDGVVDFDAVTRDPNHPLRYLPADDSGDHLHPGDAGYKAMADAVNPALFR
jgi:lysophospholipase L1-like esterase